MIPLFLMFTAWTWLWSLGADPGVSGHLFHNAVVGIVMFLMSLFSIAADEDDAGALLLLLSLFFGAFGPPMIRIFA